VAVQDHTDRIVSGASPTDTRPLLRQRDFLALLSGETISQLGSQITLFAVPMTAVLVLGASGGQIGLLKTLFTLPYFIFPLVFGVILDRRPRRSAMLIADAGRALLVFAIPLLAWNHVLAMPHLFVVAFLGGTLSVAFDVAYSSYVPSLVGRPRLAEANSRLQTGYSAAFLAGPGAAGLLVNAVGAASALVADAVSYLVSFVTIAALKFKEPTPAPDATKPRPLAEAWEGIRALFKVAPIRQLTLHATIYNGCFQLVEVAFVVYALRDKHLGPGLFGLVVTIGGIGGLCGALSSAWVNRRFGPGPAMFAAVVAESGIYFLLPAVHGSTGALVIQFGLTFLVGGAGTGIASVVAGTVRQGFTPNRLMARVGAGYRMLTLGAIPAGAALAGLLVTLFGVRNTLWIAPFGLIASVAPIGLTSFRRIRALPGLDPSLEGPAASSGDEQPARV
jgi:MFS family permease